MVSGFMHNLMTRHQDSGAEVGAAQFVQPRHRARFGTDPVPAIFSARSNHVSEFGSVAHDEAAPSAVVLPNQRISSPPALNSVPPVGSSPIESFPQESVPTERASAQLKPQVTVSRYTGTEAPFPEWGRRIEEMLYRLRTPQQQTQRGEHAPQIQAEQPHIQIVEQRTEQQQRGIHTAVWNDEQSHSAKHKIHADDSAGKRNGQPPQMRIIERQIEQQTSLGAGTVSGRIEEILQRLTSKSNESSMMPSNQSAFSERIAVIEQREAQAPLYSLEVEPALPEPEPLRQASFPAPSPHSAAGLLELPGWLNGLQADLQSRWQESAHQTQPEPVINVTIGRVEVRAMQTTKADSRPKARPQPSGVMSLDEYLKQRDSRG